MGGGNWDIIQVIPTDTEQESSAVERNKDGLIRAGEWQIRAELDASRDALLEIKRGDGAAALVTGKAAITVGGSTHRAKLAGSSLLVQATRGKPVVQESVDVPPDAAR